MQIKEGTHADLYEREETSLTTIDGPQPKRKQERLCREGQGDWDVRGYSLIRN